MRKAGLQVDIDKTEFFVTETKYLGLIISNKGIRMDPAKIQVIKDWATPKNANDEQAFLGFANFYQRYVQNFSGIARDMIELARKNQRFIWTAKCEQSFQVLKKCFLSDQVLLHFDPEKQVILEVDALG